MLFAAIAARQVLRRWDRDTPEPNSGIGYQALFRSNEPTTAVFNGSVPAALRPRVTRIKGATLVHFAFGCAAGTIYGIVRPVFPSIAFACGLPFGVALWLGAAEVGLPLAGLTRSPARSVWKIQAVGLAEHLLYSSILECWCRSLDRETNEPSGQLQRLA